jgi:hypothetical protein
MQPICAVLLRSTAILQTSFCKGIVLKCRVTAEPRCVIDLLAHFVHLQSERAPLIVDPRRVSRSR